MADVPMALAHSLAWDGHCVLIVEDDYMVAKDLGEQLRRQGASVMGPVPSVGKALAILSHGPSPDAVLLDINLQGTMSYPVADALLERGIRFAFITGYDEQAIPERYRGLPRCDKPFSLSHCLDALLAA